MQPTGVLSAFLAVLRSLRRLAYAAESCELPLRPAQEPAAIGHTGGGAETHVSALAGRLDWVHCSKDCRLERALAWGFMHWGRREVPPVVAMQPSKPLDVSARVGSMTWTADPGVSVLCRQTASRRRLQGQGGRIGLTSGQVSAHSVGRDAADAIVPSRIALHGYEANGPRSRPAIIQ